jgi:hypothetical protein
MLWGGGGGLICSVLLKNAYGLKVLKHRLFRINVGLRREQLTAGWKSCITRGSRILLRPRYTLRLSSKEDKMSEERGPYGMERIVQKLLVKNLKVTTWQTLWRMTG